MGVIGGGRQCCVHGFGIVFLGVRCSVRCGVPFGACGAFGPGVREFGREFGREFAALDGHDLEASTRKKVTKKPWVYRKNGER